MEGGDRQLLLIACLLAQHRRLSSGLWDPNKRRFSWEEDKRIVAARSLTPRRLAVKERFCGMLVVALLLAGSAGLIIGLLGGGGSVLMIPILLYVLKYPPREAIASSLFLVGVTSLVACIQRIRKGEVLWRIGLSFGTFAIVGSYTGGRLAEKIHPTILLLALGAMMFATSFAMMRPSSRSSSTKDSPSALPPDALGTPEASAFSQEPRGLEDPAAGGATRERPKPPALRWIAIQALGVGLITGLVGAGGGFLIVPALLLLGKIPMRLAVSTSMIVIALNSLFGLAGHLHHVQIAWKEVSLLTSLAIGGSLLGGALSQRIPQEILRMLFAWFILGMAIFLLFKQITLL